MLALRQTRDFPARPKASDRVRSRVGAFPKRVPQQGRPEWSWPGDGCCPSIGDSGRRDGGSSLQDRCL